VTPYVDAYGARHAVPLQRERHPIPERNRSVWSSAGGGELAVELDLAPVLCRVDEGVFDAPSDGEGRFAVVAEALVAADGGGVGETGGEMGVHDSSEPSAVSRQPSAVSRQPSAVRRDGLTGRRMRRTLHSAL